MQLERELEKDAWGDQRRFWARVNGSKEARDRMQQICSSDGRVLIDVEVRDRWKEHFEGLHGAADRSGNQKLYREATLEGEPEIVKEEVRIQSGVRMLMGRKVAGMWGIMLEMLKAGGEVVVQWLSEFFNMVWRVGV